ncbi:hypothetical protein ZHAS_00004007 [Anopheles sinensis]|uniref:Uncharacterized protein n=1 Tax=Anopheles sinensis TaxID=74873 RepID=A0A084VFU8_ANOSI|nr:hypothetical protein ZHAS_00004007 [Anopheles sinensis]
MTINRPASDVRQHPATVPIVCGGGTSRTFFSGRHRRQSRPQSGDSFHPSPRPFGFPSNRTPFPPPALLLLQLLLLLVGPARSHPRNEKENFVHRLKNWTEL